MPRSSTCVDSVADAATTSVMNDMDSVYRAPTACCSSCSASTASCTARMAKSGDEVRRRFSAFCARLRTDEYELTMAMWARSSRADSS